MAQFAGYPTAFNNTILKRFAREMYNDPIHASPKIVATTLTMTSVAALMNAIRSQGDSLEQEPGEIITRSIQRWGGMGPLELAFRYKTNAGFGSGQMGSLLKAPAGPLAQDVIDMILYRKGFAEMTANNLPGSAAYQMVFGDKYKDWLMGHARQIDKNWTTTFGPQRKTKEKVGLYGFAFGGEVNIPNAKKEPDEKIDRLTGLPYNYQAGVLGQDEEERFGFAEGGFASDDSEIMSYLTKHSRMSPPYLDGGNTIEIHSEQELKSYSKGITQTVYRKMEGNTDIEHLEDFELRDDIGVHVHTNNDGHQAGKIRLNTPLDLRARNITDFKAYNFMDQIVNNEPLRNTIIKHSKLPKLQAQERIKDLIADYKFAVKGVNDEKPVNIKKVEYALNNKLSKDTRDILNELGYDGILYKKGKDTGAILFEPGQFKAIKSSTPAQSKEDRQMDSLGFQRRQYSLGGSISRLLDKVINTKAERIRKGPAPLAFRQMFHDLAGGRDELTEADLRKDEITGFKKLIREGIKDGTIKKVGRNKWDISYDAYKTHDKSKGESKYADINFKTGIHKIIPKLNDLNFNFKTTIGQGTIIKDKNGNFIVKDQYNFNDSPGLKLQQYFTTPEGRETLGHFLKGTRYNVTRQFERGGFRPEEEVKEGESRLYPVKLKDEKYGELVGNRPFGFKPVYGQVRNFMGHFGSGTGQGSMININLGNLEDVMEDTVEEIPTPVLTPAPPKPKRQSSQDNLSILAMQNIYK